MGRARQTQKAPDRALYDSAVSVHARPLRHALPRKLRYRYVVTAALEAVTVAFVVYFYRSQSKTVPHRREHDRSGVACGGRAARASITFALSDIASLPHGICEPNRSFFRFRL